MAFIIDKNIHDKALFSNIWNFEKIDYYSMNYS